MKVYDKTSGKKLHFELKRVEDVLRRSDFDQILYALKTTVANLFSLEQIKFYLYFVLTVSLGGIGIHRIIVKKIGSGITMFLLLAVGIALFYTNLLGFVGTLVEVISYLFLGIWLLWYLIDVFSLLGNEPELISKRSASFPGRLLLFSLFVLFYQWIFINYADLPIISDTINTVDTFLLDTLPQEFPTPDSLNTVE